MDYRYSIEQFNWNKEANTFYADAWNLIAEMPDGNIHPEVFPTMKTQFFIHNYKTDGFRRFRFVKEQRSETNEAGYDFLEWIFESEDGIKCHICVEP